MAIDIVRSDPVLPDAPSLDHELPLLSLNSFTRGF